MDDDNAMSPLADVVDPQQADLNWKRLAEETTTKVASLLATCRTHDMLDGRASFIWRLRTIAAVRALYEKVRLPRNDPQHIPSREWVTMVKTLCGVGRTQAHRLIQRRVADRFQLAEIITRVAKLEDAAVQRHRPVSYPTIGKMIGWFPDPMAPPRGKKPKRTTAQDAYVAELEAQIEMLHAEKGDQTRMERLLVAVILAQQLEVERLRGFTVVDDRRTRSGTDTGKIGDAMGAEILRKGLLP